MTKIKFRMSQEQIALNNKQAKVQELLLKCKILDLEHKLKEGNPVFFDYIEEVKHTALRLATIIHGDQLDKCGRPYLQHVGRVAAGGKNWLEHIAGILHDVVEDSHGVVTELTLRDLGFPPIIVDAVLLISRNTSPKYVERMYTDVNHPAARVKCLATLLHPDKTHIWPDKLNQVFLEMRRTISDTDYMLGLENSWLARATKLNDSKDNADVSRWGFPSLDQLGKSHKYQSKAAWLSCGITDDGGNIVKSALALKAMHEIGVPLCYEIVKNDEFMTRIEVGLVNGRRSAERSTRRLCSLSFTRAGGWCLTSSRTILESEFVPDHVVPWRIQVLGTLEILKAAGIEEMSVSTNSAVEFAEEREYNRIMNSIY